MLGSSKLTHDLRRKTSFDVTELTVRLLRPEDPIPTPETYVKELPQRKPVQMTLTTYGSRTVGNLRQSKRLRQVGVFGKRKKVAVSRTTTIRDLKVKVRRSHTLAVVFSASQPPADPGAVRYSDDLPASVLPRP